MLAHSPFLHSSSRPSVHVSHGGRALRQHPPGLGVRRPVAGPRETRAAEAQRRARGPARLGNRHAPRGGRGGRSTPSAKPGPRWPWGKVPSWASTSRGICGLGHGSVARNRGCPLIDMDRRPCVEVPVPEGQVIHSLKVCAEVMEFDFIVSIPVMKTTHAHGRHAGGKEHEGLPLAAEQSGAAHVARGRGEQGQVARRRHCRHGVRPPPPPGHRRRHGGHGRLGPSAGRPKPLDAVVVSGDAFAADAVACQLMGAAAEQIPHLRLGAERGYGMIDLARLTVTPDHWRDFGLAVCPSAGKPDDRVSQHHRDRSILVQRVPVDPAAVPDSLQGSHLRLLSHPRPPSTSRSAKATRNCRRERCSSAIAPRTTAAKASSSPAALRSAVRSWRPSRASRRPMTRRAGTAQG